jgi:hypothetical protein
MTRPAVPQNENELIELLNRECNRRRGNLKRVAWLTATHEKVISQQRAGKTRISERVAKHLGFTLRWVQFKGGQDG